MKTKVLTVKRKKVKKQSKKNLEMAKPERKRYPYKSSWQPHYAGHMLKQNKNLF
jgi:hypothetical protein